MNQKEIIKKLKIAKIENDFFTYGDIAQMLNIKTSSLYNWLSGQFLLCSEKAKILNDWLNEME